MRWATRLYRRLRSIVRPGHVEQELDEELRYHVERLTEDFVASGLPQRDAHYAAMRAMGAMQQHKEASRDALGITLLENVWQDCRYAARSLRRTPGFAAVALLSLAIGIGANTTIFTFVNAVLLRPLPYPQSDRLALVRERALTATTTINVHPGNFLEWQLRARAFESMALVQTPPLNILGASGAEQIGRVQTTPALFRVFAVEPVLGRDLSEDDARAGSPEVAILGYSFWQRWYGGDPAVVGRTLEVPGGSIAIVGVAPPGMQIGTIEPDVYTPLRIDRANPGAIGSRSFQCYARLKNGVEIQSAAAEMTAIAADLALTYKFDEGMGVAVYGLHDYLVRDSRAALGLLTAVVATVLIIACVNLAGLLMARGLSRRDEFAVRAALGASRGRLIRQLVIESLVLAIGGGIAGLLLADGATRALIALTAGALTLGNSAAIELDMTCVLFTFAVSTVTALAFGLVPALHAGRPEGESGLHERGRGTTADARQHRIRGMLVVSEIALAVVLLVGAGLLLRSFSSLARVDLGFEPTRTLTMSLFLGDTPPAARVALVDQILERVEGIPGVRGAGTIQFLPLSGATCGTGAWLDSRQSGDPSQAVSIECSLISRGYFRAMGIALLRGRDFERRDNMRTARVLIVNEAFVRRYLRGEQALGRRILVQGSNQAEAEIVGVVHDTRHSAVTTEPAPTVFLLHAQTPGYITNLVVGSDGDPTAHVSAVRQAIHDVDRTQAIANVKTMDRYVSTAVARPKLYAALVSGFAAIAAILAAIGIYGVVAYIVAQRTPEIGIRLALGATRGAVFVEQLRQGATLVAVGYAVGLAAAAAIARGLTGYLFGVTPSDPLTYLLAGALFAAVALAAVAVPAHRASRIEPIIALRRE